jgi:hypothetical protein
MTDRAIRKVMLAMGLLLSSCNEAKGKMKTIQADFGDTSITLDVAEELDVTPLAGGGVRLAPRGAAQLRRSYEMTLTPGGGGSTIPLQQSHGTGQDEIRYGTELAEGGSGGPEATLIAERKCRDVVVRLRVDRQIEEDQMPDWQPILTMLAEARCSSRP